MIASLSTPLSTPLPTRADLTSRLQRVWSLRRGQDLQGAWIEFLSLKGALALAPGAAVLAPSDSQFQRLIPHYGVATIESLAALAAAIERGQGRVPESEQIISEAMLALAHQGEATEATQSLRFERGLNSFIQGDYVKAVEDFVRVYESTCVSDPASLGALALLNLVLCLENLGVPYERQYAQLKSRSVEEPLNQGLTSQLQALELRRAFRRGEFPCLTSAEELRLSGQALYFAAWTSELPYLETKTPGAVSRVLIGEGQIFNRRFRIRTLQGQLSPRDLDVLKPSEAIDRLYLWVWRWVQGGDASLLQKCLMLLSRGQLLDRLDRLTREDTLLLENALLWLALFDTASTERLAQIQSRIPSIDREGFPVLDLERRLLAFLHARRTGQVELLADFETDLKAHTLYRQPAVLLGQFESHSCFARVRALFAAGPVAQPAGCMVVDLKRGLIRTANGPKKVSLPTALVLHLIEREGAVDFERLAEVAFGVRKFESSVHAAKLANLLSRARKMLPASASIHCRDGQAVCMGDWSQVSFVGVDSNEITLGRFVEWIQVFGGPAESARYRVHARVRDFGDSMTANATGVATEMSRADLERLIDRPRSTTNRLIANWIKRGYLTRDGQGRSTKYVLSLDFKRMLLSQGVPK